MKPEFIPGWVMCGAELDDGTVCLYASNTLSHAELEAEVDDFGSWGSPVPIAQRKTYTITATMKSLVVLHAADWPSAFRALFNQWSPDADTSSPTQIGARALQIPGADTP